MRRSLAAIVLIVGLAVPCFAGTAKDCLDLSVERDGAVASPQGIRAIVTFNNHCNENAEGGLWVTVRVVDRGNKVIGSQVARMGQAVPGRSHAEMRVFVKCDPDKVQSVTVE
jgi:hypothetical protein